MDTLRAGMESQELAQVPPLLKVIWAQIRQPSTSQSVPKKIPRQEHLGEGSGKPQDLIGVQGSWLVNMKQRSGNC